MSCKIDMFHFLYLQIRVLHSRHYVQSVLGC
uniref:Uncharacterized protein n=1 Tax=Myoviridae sp. ctxjh1 TaxID=2826714 RepID=A0A8S5R0F9_9CAUD|nr:MAG TPA: hypothetical protein [Myoviridae sp. ctxjh1]